MTDVLNGSVSAGDRVVYAVKDSTRAHMRIAEVMEVLQVKRYSWDKETRPALKVRVVQTSGYEAVPYEAIVRELGRVVKIGS
jgi:hypothetical protein